MKFDFNCRFDPLVSEMVFKHIDGSPISAILEPLDMLLTSTIEINC